MPLYLISFGAHAMDHLAEEDMPAVAAAARAVSQEAATAGVLVCAGGLEDEPARVVAVDGTLTDGPHPDSVAGLTLVDVTSLDEALAWAAKLAVACRCPQEVRAIGADPEIDAMLQAAR